MSDDFAATVSKWVAETTDRSERVFKKSAQDVLKIAQTPGPTVATTKKAIKKGLKGGAQGPVFVKSKGGLIPVDLGTLRNSHVSGLNGATDQEGATSYTLTIQKAKLGDVINGGWTAPYAMRIEFGFTGQDSLGRSYNQPPVFFMRSAAQQWPQIVKANAAAAKARAKK